MELEESSRIQYLLAPDEIDDKDCFDVLEASCTLIDSDNGDIVWDWGTNRTGLSALVLNDFHQAQQLLERLLNQGMIGQGYEVRPIGDVWAFMRKAASQGLVNLHCLNVRSSTDMLIIEEGDSFAFFNWKEDAANNLPTILGRWDGRDGYTEFLSRISLEPEKFNYEDLVSWESFDLSDKKLFVELGSKIPSGYCFPTFPEGRIGFRNAITSGIGEFDGNFYEIRGKFDYIQWNDYQTYEVTDIVGKWDKELGIIAIYSNIYNLLSHITQDAPELYYYYGSDNYYEWEHASEIEGNQYDMNSLSDTYSLEAQEFIELIKEYVNSQYLLGNTINWDNIDSLLELIPRYDLRIQPIADLKSRIAELQDEYPYIKNTPNANRQGVNYTITVNPDSMRTFQGYVEGDNLVNVFGSWKIMPNNSFANGLNFSGWNRNQTIGWSGEEIFQFTPLIISLAKGGNKLTGNSSNTDDVTYPEAKEIFDVMVKRESDGFSDGFDHFRKMFSSKEWLEGIVNLDLEAYQRSYIIFDQHSHQIIDELFRNQVVVEMEHMDEIIAPLLRDQGISTINELWEFIWDRLTQEPNYYSRNPNVDHYSNLHFMSYWFTKGADLSRVVYDDPKIDKFAPLIQGTFIDAILWLWNYEIKYDRYFRIYGLSPIVNENRLRHWESELYAEQIKIYSREADKIGKLFQSGLESLAIGVLVDGYKPKHSRQLVRLCNRFLCSITVNFAGYGKDLLHSVNVTEFFDLVGYMGIKEDQQSKFKADWDSLLSSEVFHIDHTGEELSIARMGEPNWYRLTRLSKHFIATALTTLKEWGSNPLRDYAPISLEVVKSFEVELSEILREYRSQVTSKKDADSSLTGHDKSLFDFLYNDDNPPTLGQIRFLLSKPDSNSSKLGISFYNYIKSLPNGDFLLSSKFRRILSRTIHKYRNGGVHDSAISYDTCIEAIDVIIGTKDANGILARILAR